MPAHYHYTRPWLYFKQLNALFNDSRYSIIEASTKSGKTVGALAWLFELAIQGKSGRNYWWIAPVYPQAEIAYRRLKKAIPQEIYTANESKLTITLFNGAVIWFKSAEKPDNLYGEDVWGAVIDEATRAREEAWHAIRSTLTATQGPIRIIGNVKGRKNWAYVLARRAESGEPNMSYHRITCADAIEAGIITQDEVDDARRQLPEDVFKELYETIPSDSGGNPFGLSAIRACIKPLSSLPPMWFGVDLAKSVDWTVIIGLDKFGQCCRFDRVQMPWQETEARVESTVGSVKTLVDSTGVGDPIVESLHRRHFNIEGYHFTQISKQQLMEGLANAIQKSAVSFPDGVIVNELESFEYEYVRNGVRYKAMEGMHDDCVCALALAVQNFTQRIATHVSGIEKESRWK